MVLLGVSILEKCKQDWERLRSSFGRSKYEPRTLRTHSRCRSQLWGPSSTDLYILFYYVAF
jgi:hypothetical protein